MVKLRHIVCTSYFALMLAACGGGGGGGGGDACADGALECTCSASQPCAEGLACIDRQCQRPDELELTVSDPAARSCELLVREADARVVGATFAPSVTGVHLRQGPHSAVSFFANDDAAISPGSISLQVATPSADAAEVEVVTTHCYDRDGRELAGATVRTGA
ncbi:hypothetical protein [Haliangium sp.]